MKRAFPLVASLFALLGTSSLAEDTCHFAVVFPGGPRPGSSGQQVIDDFAARLGEKASVAVEAAYFNETGPALEFLGTHPDSFVLGSTGFFLAQREALGLHPLARVSLPDGREEQYFLVASEGSASALADLEGKKVVGTPFHEAPAFLDRIVFGGEIESGAFFDAEPTGRPLSALRKLSSGDIDAVFLNAPQFASLEALPLDAELATVFESAPISSVGLMRLDSEVTRSHAGAMKEAIIELSQTEEGRELCQNFGIAGFAAVDEEAVAALVKRFEGGDSGETESEETEDEEGNEDP